MTTIQSECCPYLEAVASPVMSACDIPLTNFKGLVRVMMKKPKVKVMHACIKSPISTVAIYRPSDLAVRARFSILMILPAMRQQRPKGAYL